MCLMPAFLADASLGFDPLPRAFAMRFLLIPIQDVHALAEERAPSEDIIAFSLIAGSLETRRHRMCVLDELFPTRAFTHETQRCGEDRLASLSSLDSPRAETPPFAHVLDVVDDGHFGVAVENKIAVHAVDGEVGGDGALGCGEALSDGSAAIDAAGAGRVPQRACVGEEIGLDGRERGQGKGVFDRSVGRDGGRRFDQGREVGHVGVVEESDRGEQVVSGTGMLAGRWEMHGG